MFPWIFSHVSYAQKYRRPISCGYCYSSRVRDLNNSDWYLIIFALRSLVHGWEFPFTLWPSQALDQD